MSSSVLYRVISSAALIVVLGVVGPVALASDLPDASDNPTLVALRWHFDQEATDTSWEASQVAAIERVRGEPDFAELTIDSLHVECRTTVCRLIISGVSAEEPASTELLWRFTVALARLDGFARKRAITTFDEERLVEIYLPRDGFELNGELPRTP